MNPYLKLLPREDRRDGVSKRERNEIVIFVSNQILPDEEVRDESGEEEESERERIE